MGEIGFPRREFLHDIAWWEVRSIIRGYNRRNRDIWSASRWQTYHVMMSLCGSEAMKKAGIYKPTDLITFPWENVVIDDLTDEEKLELQEEMKNIML